MATPNLSTKKLLTESYMSKKHFLILISLTTLFYACKRDLTGTASSAKNNKLEIQAFDFDYLRGKAKVNYLENNERQNVKANIRIKKDSVIWIQFAGVGGIEGGRVLITKDSLTMIDRINKEFYSSSYEELANKYRFEVSYQLIESMIIGNLPFGFEKKDRVSRQSDHFLIRQKSDIHSVENYVSRSTQRLEKVSIEQASTRNTLNLLYKDFNMVNEVPFPFNSSATLKYNDRNKTLFTEINLIFSKAEIPDKPLKFPFNIPQKYARR